LTFAYHAVLSALTATCSPQSSAWLQLPLGFEREGNDSDRERWGFPRRNRNWKRNYTAAEARV